MARKRKKKGANEKEVDANAWMITFSDLLTLLLTFFVLLLSMSSMDDKSLKSMFAAFMGSVGVMDYADEGSIEPYLPTSQVLTPQEVKEILQKVMEFYQEKTLDFTLSHQGISVSSQKNSVFVTFPGNFLFEKDSVAIRDESWVLLKELITVVKKTKYRIRIEGHTDNTPVKNSLYPSSWHISTMRAVNVLRYFLQEGLSPDRLTAVGYGNYYPVFPNDREGHMAKNRRVEIILEKVVDKGGV